MNLCQGVHGYIQAGEDGYVITPAGGGEVSLESLHEVVRLGPGRGGRERRAASTDRNGSLTGDEDMFTWYDVDLDEEMARQEEEFSNIEWEGYVADKVWQVWLSNIVTDCYILEHIITIININSTTLLR